MDMIERVARAIAQAASVQSDNGVPPKWSDWRNEARAAIEAMKEPTKGMLQAGRATSPDEWHNPDPLEAWESMIDAALNRDRIVDWIDLPD